MKIFYVLTKFPAPSETFAANDVRALKNAGIDVHVFSQRRRDANHYKMVEERGLRGVNIETGGLREVLGGLMAMAFHPYLFYCLLFRLIFKELDKPRHLVKLLALLPVSFFIFSKISKQRPDIVHLFWGHYPSLVGYLLIKSGLKSKLTIFLGAYDLQMKLSLSQWVANRCSCVFTHSFSNVSDIKSIGVAEKNIAVIHRGVDITRLEKGWSWVHSEKTNQIVTASRLIGSKRIDKVIDLLPLLQNYKLNVFGDGPDFKKLVNYCQSLGISDRVNFLGHVNQRDLFHNLKKARLFILLSEKLGERLPNVVKEAMLAGCLCVVSHTPGIDELIVHKNNGIVLTNTDSENVFYELNKLNNAQVQSIAFKARKTIKKKFDVDVLIREYIAVWISIIE